MNMYANNQIQVRWKNAVSEPFGTTNGVKQGSILQNWRITVMVAGLAWNILVLSGLQMTWHFCLQAYLVYKECSIYAKLFLPALVLLLMQRRLVCIKFHYGHHVNEITQYTIFLGNDKLKWYLQIKLLGHTFNCCENFYADVSYRKG